MLPKALVDDEGCQDETSDDYGRPKKPFAEVPPADQVRKAVDGRLVAVVPAPVK